MPVVGHKVVSPSDQVYKKEKGKGLLILELNKQGIELLYLTITQV